jgi:pilus assembly protein FimV
MRKRALAAIFCLAWLADSAWALGLGDIQVYSALNQPLRAEISLFAVKPGEVPLINAQLASDEAFARAGIERLPVLGDLRFRVVEGDSPDQAILQVSTLQSVREPFVSMLLEVSWPDGRLVREYTLLLDPPVIASGQVTRQPQSSFSQPVYEGGYAGADQPPRAAAAAGGRSYGPVRAQETLWSIAYALRPDDSISMNQMMQAIYEANPEAFDGSISRIRAGSMLRIPSVDEIRGTDPSQARREVARERRGSTPRPAPATVDDLAPVAKAPAPAERPPAKAPQGELRLSPAEAPASPAADAAAQSPAQMPAETEAAEASAPPAAAAAPVAPKTAAPIEIRDNSAKALELLATHAREHAARQTASDQLAAETAQAAAPVPAPAPAPAETAKPAEAAAPEPAAAPPAEPATPAAPASPAATSPFVDEAAPADAAAAPAASTTPPAPAEEAPPPAVDVTAPASAPPPVAQVDEALPGAGAETAAALNPLMLGLGAVAVLLLLLAAARLRQQRARKASVPIAPIVLSKVEEASEPLFAGKQETPARPAPGMGDTLRTKVEPAVARTVETTLHSTLPPEQTTRQFMAVSTPEPAPVMPSMVEPAAPGANDPYADVLGEVDIHIAYGLYDEAARLLQDPLAKSPERKDLHLKLLEVYFSANMAREFEAQAGKLRALVAGAADPDWEKACIMGRQLCPESALFAGSAGMGGSLSTGADLDISSMLGGETLTPAAPAAPKAVERAAPPAASEAPPSLDLDLSGFELGVSDADGAKAAAATPAAPVPDTGGNTLDFNLDDFKLDAPAPAAASKPAPTAAAPADSGLDIDLSDFDVGTSETASVPTADQSGDVAIDDLLSPEHEAGEGQADTRLDLARAYLDMGEPAMAQSLLQEVIAQGNAAQKQEAQELLGRIGTG